MIRVLFTGGGGAGNEAVYRLLAGRYETHFADACADESAIAPEIPKNRQHAVPFANTDGFTKKLLALCEKLKIDLLVPGVDEELLHLPEIQQGCPDIKILAPDADYISLMLDKLRAFETLHEKGLNVPVTVTVDQANSIGFPCLAKPRRGRGSRGIQILKNAAQVRSLLDLSGIPETDIIVQELLEGQEYTVMMAADRFRRLHAVVPVKVLEKRGITIRAETQWHSNVIAACQTIHETLPAWGCYNIQLIVTRDGRVMPFEINPRISTTFCLGVAAGVDPLEIYLCDSSPVDLRPFKEGLRLHRYWFNHITS